MAVIRSISTVLFLFGLLLFYSEMVLSDFICVGDEHSDDYSGPKPNCSGLVSNLVEATQEITHNSTIMLLRGEEVISSSVIMIENLVNINLTSIKSTRIVCEQQSVGSGITFINVTNLTLSHITVESCGALHNVTDKGELEYYFSSAVYLENCTNIDIGYIKVTDSYGTGLCVFNSNGFITIHHSLFINNTVVNGSVDTSELLLGGGGIYFELSECSPQWQDCDPYSNTYSINNTININNCIITNNSVLADPDSIQFTNFRGGGLIFWVRGMSYNNTAVIEDSVFEGNTGLYGGGLFVQFYGRPTYNNVTIKNITSKGNMARLGGGGIDLGFYSFRPHLNRHNNITVISSIIMRNRAYFGGGNAFFSTLVTNTDPNNRVEFYDTLWTLNRATYGSAVYLEPVINDVPANSFFPIPRFTNCNFTQNFIVVSVSGNSAGVSVSSVGAGAMNSKAISAQLEGSILFEANNGTAVYFIDCIFLVEENTSIIFRNNSGTYGGAMSINGFASLYIKSNVSLMFTNNYATVKGGAIYFFSTDIKTSLLTGSSCFVERFRTRNRFETSFYFRNNTDSFNKTLFISSLLPCNKLCQGTNVYLTYIEPERLLTDECIGNFTFVDHNGLVSANVATETSEFVHDGTTRDIFLVVPGKDFTLPFTTIDEFDHNSTEPLFAVLSSNNNNENIPKLQNIYTANNRFQVKGQSNDTGHLEIRTLDFRNLTVGLDIKLTECPPGFINKDDTCLCSADYIGEHYDGITRCDNQEFQASIVSGLWVGYKDKLVFENNLYTATCPPGYCNDSYTSSTKLPSEANATVLSTLICGDKKRTGVLCGECIKDHCVYFNSPTYKCGSNDNCSYGALYYILSSILPLSLLFTIVVLFGVNLSSGALNGFVFYAQIIGYFASGETYTTKFEQVLHLISVLLYGPFSLKFFNENNFSFCLFKEGNFLTIMGMEALSLLFALVLVIILVLVMKSNYFYKLQFMCCKRPIFKPTTLTKALTTFLILCYSQTTQICFEVLHIGFLRGKGGGIASARVFRMGNQDYFAGWHILCAIIALIGILTVVTITPLCLILYPVFFKIIPPTLQERKLISFFVAKVETLKPVFDAFQGCYKDEYRFFAGLYFLYRAIFVGVFALIGIHLASLSVAQVFLMIVLSLHLWIQPYQTPLHNRIDGALFLCLGIITTLSFTRHFETTSQSQQWVDLLTFTGLLQLFFVYIPGVVALIAVVVLAMRKCCKKVAEKEFIVKQKKEKDELTETLQYHGHTITTSYLNMEDIRSDDDLREEFEVLNIN